LLRNGARRQLIAMKQLNGTARLAGDYERQGNSFVRAGVDERRLHFRIRNLITEIWDFYLRFAV
jgi:hypothetical protein